MIDTLFKYVTGIVKLRGGTDNTIIGNTGSNLQVTDSTSQGILNTIASNTGAIITDTLVTGNIIALNGVVTLTNTQGDHTIVAQITGTWVATLIAEGRLPDSTTWQQIPMFQLSTTLPYLPTTSTTANGNFIIITGGYTQIRIRASAYSSGTAAISLDASIAQQSVYAAQLGNWLLQGNSAAATTDSGNPMKVGFVAKTTQPTAVTDGQRVNALGDKIGRQATVPYQVRDLVGSPVPTTITNSTAETTFLTAVASTFLDLVHLTITNASNQAVTCTIKDSTAGTNRFIVDLAAQGGWSSNFTVPVKQSAVNNNWTITLSSNTVTVHVNAIAVQNI